MVDPSSDSVNVAVDSISGTQKPQRQIRPRKPLCYTDDFSEEDVRGDENLADESSNRSWGNQSDESASSNTDFHSQSRTPKKSDPQRLAICREFTKWTKRSREGANDRFASVLPEPSPFASLIESVRGVFVPDWAVEVTTDDSERLLLGHLDYWLGIRRNGAPRTKRHNLYANPQDGHVFLVVTAGFIGKRLGKSNTQVRRILDRLKKKGFLIAERHRRSTGVFATRIRLNWDQILEAYDRTIMSGDWSKKWK